MEKRMYCADFCVGNGDVGMWTEDDPRNKRVGERRWIAKGFKTWKMRSEQSMGIRHQIWLMGRAKRFRGEVYEKTDLHSSAFCSIIYSNNLWERQRGAEC